MMPSVEIAAHQAADRERDLRGSTIRRLTVDEYDLYVRAFLAGAQWQKSEIAKTTNTKMWRDGELPSNAPDTRTASPRSRGTVTTEEGRKGTE